MPDNHGDWCRMTFGMLAEGGVWGVPRSGLTFQKRGTKLVLISRMPWTAEDTHGEARHWRAYQDEDYEAIRDEFGKAGITVEDGT